MPAIKSANADDHKKTAAAAAVKLVENGMVLGLGTGTTMWFVLNALAARVTEGLQVTSIATSNQTADRAKELGIPLTNFQIHRHIDLTLDGADEVEPAQLDLIKGAGGALLREKIVAAASKQLVIVVDESKIVKQLGTEMPVPVEIVSFGHQTVMERLTEAGMRPTLRMAGDRPYLTDGGNYIADCALKGISNPLALEASLKSMVGVIESGIFTNLASRVVVGGSAGVKIIEKH